MTMPATCLSPPTIATYIALACVMVLVSGVALGLIWYLRHLERRDRQHWQREAELRRQLWELEQQIREEGLPDEVRRWHGRDRQRQAAITREARRRLGLPEEDAPPC